MTTAIEKPLCSIEGCARTSKTRGWCNTHYERWRVHGDVTHNTNRYTCSIDGCGFPHKSHGWCVKHYERWRVHGDAHAPVRFKGVYEAAATCGVEGCESLRKQRDWCIKHYARWQNNGDPDVVQNVWNEPGKPCRTCGAEIEKLGSRLYCSRACARVGLRDAAGEQTFLSRTTCIDCSVFMPLVTSGGFRKRGNGFGRCQECADRSPCATCGEPRKRSGGVLVCRPCRRPRAAADELLRRARILNAVCQHGDKCVTRDMIHVLRQQPCFYCEAPADHADHFEPLARGGKHCRGNLVPACAPCNLAKSDNDPWLWWGALTN